MGCTTILGCEQMLALVQLCPKFPQGVEVAGQLAA